MGGKQRDWKSVGILAGLGALGAALLAALGYAEPSVAAIAWAAMVLMAAATTAWPEEPIPGLPSLRAPMPLLAGRLFLIGVALTSAGYVFGEPASGDDVFRVMVLGWAAWAWFRRPFPVEGTFALLVAVAGWIGLVGGRAGTGLEGLPLRVATAGTVLATVAATHHLLTLAGEAWTARRPR